MERRQTAASQGGKQNPLDNYVTVAERIAAFYQLYPQGRIYTHIVEHDSESGFILMRAEVFRSPDDAQPAATGHAFEVRSESYVNRTSYVENCETGCVGRALALLGFEVKRGLASREELEKVERMRADSRSQTPEKQQPQTETRPQEERADAEPRGREQRPVEAAAPPADDVHPDVNAAILQSAGELGYDAAKVRKWVNQKYSVTGGLDSLTETDKREVLEIFRERAAGMKEVRNR